MTIPEIQKEKNKKPLDSDSHESTIAIEALEQYKQFQRHLKGMISSGTTLLALINAAARVQARSRANNDSDGAQ
jgi:Tfp pilus assembly protein PilP